MEFVHSVEVLWLDVIYSSVGRVAYNLNATIIILIKVIGKLDRI